MTPAATTPAWHTVLVQAWTHRGLLAWLLWPVSLVFGVLVALRHFFYRQGWLSAHRLPVPVLVVGNLVAGGAGKTPVVIALVEHLQARGIQVGVISRGYGRSLAGCIEVTADHTAQQLGDEPMLIRQRTGVPVFVAERRVQAATALLARYPSVEIILSDDGLQHLSLLRDLEIGVFDDRGVGNGFLLPAGPLREPWPRALDLLLHTGSHPAFEGFRAHRSLAAFARRADGSRVSLAELAAAPDSGQPARPVLALAAIAQPDVFFGMLRAQGVTLARTLALPDHYDFHSFEVNKYMDFTLICTEKDAVKLWPRATEVLAVPLHCQLPVDFLRALDARIDRLLEKPAPTKRLSSRHGHTTT